MSRSQVALLLTLLAANVAGAAYVSPQVEDLEALRVESTVPVQIAFRAGFPVSVSLDVARPGGQPSDFVAVARQFLADYANLYLQDHPDIELVHSRTDATAEGRRIVRFGQSWRELSVFGAELVVTLRVAGPLVHVTGTAGMLLSPARIDRDPPVELEIDLAPGIPAEVAEEAARAAVGELAAPLAGATRLVIFDPPIVGRTGAPILAWRVTLGADVQVLVDADTGSLVYTRGLAATDAPDADHPEDDYDLQIDDAFGDLDEGTCFAADYDPQTIADEDGLDPAWLIDADAVKIFDSAWATYLTYHNVFGRHSWDDDDEQIEIFIHVTYMNGFPNANANINGCLTFSLGMASLDVLAHEFTHQVIDHTSELVGSSRVDLQACKLEYSIVSPK